MAPPATKTYAAVVVVAVSVVWQALATGPSQYVDLPAVRKAYAGIVVVVVTIGSPLIKKESRRKRKAEKGKRQRNIGLV